MLCIIKWCYTSPIELKLVQFCNYLNCDVLLANLLKNVIYYILASFTCLTTVSLGEGGCRYARILWIEWIEGEWSDGKFERWFDCILSLIEIIVFNKYQLSSRLTSYTC